MVSSQAKVDAYARSRVRARASRTGTDKLGRLHELANVAGIRLKEKEREMCSTAKTRCDPRVSRAPVTSNRKGAGETQSLPRLLGKETQK